MEAPPAATALATFENHRNAKVDPLWLEALDAATVVSQGGIKVEKSNFQVNYTALDCQWAYIRGTGMNRIVGNKVT